MFNIQSSSVIKTILPHYIDLAVVVKKLATKYGEIQISTIEEDSDNCNTVPNIADYLGPTCACANNRYQQRF